MNGTAAGKRSLNSVRHQPAANESISSSAAGWADCKPAQRAERHREEREEHAEDARLPAQ